MPWRGSIFSPWPTLVSRPWILMKNVLLVCGFLDTLVRIVLLIELLSIKRQWLEIPLWLHLNSWTYGLNVRSWVFLLLRCLHRSYPIGIWNFVDEVFFNFWQRFNPVAFLLWSVVLWNLHSHRFISSMFSLFEILSLEVEVVEFVVHELNLPRRKSERFPVYQTLYRVKLIHYNEVWVGVPKFDSVYIVLE